MNKSIIFPELPLTRRTPDGYKNDWPGSPQMQALVAEAETMGIAWEVVPNSYFLKLTSNGHSEYFRNGVDTKSFAVGRRICVEKAQTRAFLEAAGLPVARGFAVLSHDTVEDREKIFAALKKPLVVKPANNAHGNGVKLNITSFEQMNEWIDHLFSTYERDADATLGTVLVEETAPGKEYRILATKDALLAVMHRQPANVTGDGEHTILQLIDLKNEDPMRHISEALYPTIKADEDMQYVLHTQGLDFESVPTKNQQVQLRFVSNIMAGGDAVDMTDEVHTSVAEVAKRVAQALPAMALVGFDFMSTDITADQANQAHHIIEVNSAPEWTMHDYPMIGKKRGVARTILQLAFPELQKE